MCLALAGVEIYRGFRIELSDLANENTRYSVHFEFQMDTEMCLSEVNWAPYIHPVDQTLPHVW